MQRRPYRQIVIRYTHVPTEIDDNDTALDQIYESLGLGDERDDVGKLVFRAIVKSTIAGEGISSRDIMELGTVSQAAIIYHLNIFQRAGLVVKEGRSYFLRANNLSNTLEDMESDIRRRFERLKKIAKKIDDAYSP
ncbi:helix-turn-helix transcriptional regulator [Candidatus Micrarchaeota archaeon]|nr:helix-turn-helix transcriptional regulator [Candidatus Micrarchaeota archaeon]